MARDEDGKTIGTGRLEFDLVKSTNTQCVYTFAMDVKSAEFYSFEVGHRGELTYSQAEMESMDWTVAFTLGD